MPINSDGTISAPLQRYVTRVVLEWSYNATPDYAEENHKYILESVNCIAVAVDECLALDGARPQVHVSNAKHPVALDSKSPQPLPEGEEVTEGSSEKLLQDDGVTQYECSPTACGYDGDSYCANCGYSKGERDGA